MLRLLTRPNLGGPTRQAVALYHAFAARGVPTLLVVGACDTTETAIDLVAAGLPELALAEALAAGPAARGFVTLPGLRRGLQPFGDWRAGRALRQLLRTLQPEVLHTHTSKAGWLGRVSGHRAAVPCLAHTFHGHVLQDYFPRPAGALLAALERRLARHTDLLLAISPSCADELAAAGVSSRQRFTVVPPAVPLPAFAARSAARARLGIATAAFQVAAIGRLVPIKRMADFVAVVRAMPDCRGDLIGDGPLAGELATAAVATEGRLRLCGAVPDIATCLPAYDALLLPSIREGCPLVAIEAFAAGVPVVGYDVPGVRDVLADWGSGLLVPPAAGPAGLVAALRRLRDDAALRQQLVVAGRAAAARFAPAAIADQLLRAYAAVLGRGG